MSSPAVLLQNGTLYDGLGGEGMRRDVELRDGKVARIAERIEPAAGAQIIDATGRWVVPGFIDLHTHYDAELEIAPGLTESVRHGVTSVVLGSCSLSMAIGKPVDLADMYCRVEGVPREVVLPLLEERKDWDGPASYLDHVDSLPLGPNVASFIGHSALRAHVLGMGKALDKRYRPSASEMSAMAALVEESLDAGYLGLSVQTLPWDKMDGEAFRSRPLPSVFARWKEYRQLASILRRRERVLQGVPDVSTKLNVLLFLLISTGVFRKALKTTIISMMDVRADRAAFRIAGALSRFFNKALRADFRMQALPEPFDLWADGMDLVVFEEFGAGTAALHLRDLGERTRLLRDPEYRARFKRDWRRKLMPRAFHRNLDLCEILECPDASLVGKSFGELAAARGQDAVDVFLDLVIEHGRELRWYTVMGNDRKDWLRWIVRHPDVLIGFSDAGAHLRNMAHYNFPLRMLKLVRDAQNQGAEFMTTGRAVQRLTAEIAEWLGMDAGVLAEGKRADVVVLNPEGLDDTVDAAQEQDMPGFPGLKRLVRRNDQAVDAVFIAGKMAFAHGELAADLGKSHSFGRTLRTGT